MADLRIVDAPVLQQESITDDVKMPTGGLGNYAIRLGDLVWYVVAKENLASKSYVDNSSKGVQDKLDAHVADKNNPHQVTKEQVGLGNVDNTADIDKPVSNAVSSAIITATNDMATKAYVDGKGGDLSTLTTTEKTTLVKAINEVVSVKANKEDVALSINSLTDNKANKATTLLGYGISDAYTKSEIDTDYGGVKTLYNKNAELGEGTNGWDANLIVYGETTQKQINDGFESVSQLVGIQNPRNGMRVYVKSYHAGLNKGGGEFVYDSTKASLNDGGLTINGWVRHGHTYITPEIFGAVGNGVTDDTVKIQAAINAVANNGGGIVRVTSGHYILTPQNDSAALIVPKNVTLIGDEDHTIFELVTATNDDPNTSVWWDTILFNGVDNSDGGVQNITFTHTGGRRNNCATIAVRGGANTKKITGNTIKKSIGSAIVIESSVLNPTVTRCLVGQNTISKTARHGTYIIGATHNTVQNNIYDDTGLESIALRANSDNDVLNNDFYQSTSSSHAITLAAPPSGSKYKYYRLKIKGNRVFGYKGAGFYGQGVGCSLYDSDISDNTINLLDDESVTHHNMMLYRTYRTKIKNNQIVGGRNRGIMLYGCSDNELVSNTIRNVNSAGNSVGCVMFADYTDSDGKSFSTNNIITDTQIIDDRQTASHMYGIQFVTGCNNNTIKRSKIVGNTSTKILSADGLDKQIIGDVVEKFQWYTPTALAAVGGAGATTALTQIPVIGNTYTSVVNAAAYLKQLRLTTRQIATGGTITANLSKNGGFLFSIVLNADGVKTTIVTQFTEHQIDLVAGDVLSVFIKADNLTSGQSSIDCTVHAVTAI